jgi:hypothetical protein
VTTPTPASVLIHLCRIAAENPNLAVITAIQFAEADARGEKRPFPDPGDPAALAQWATTLPAVIDNIPERKVQAIKELRVAGARHGITISLADAKRAVEHLQGML